MFTILQGFDGYYYNKDLDAWEFVNTQDWVFAKVFDSSSPHGRPAMLPSKFIIKQEFTPKNLDDMLILTRQLVKDNNVVAIRGQKVVEGSPIRRNKANFNTSIPSNIIAMDVDGIPIPKEINILDITSQAKYIIKLLNEIDEEMFPLDTGFIVHASSSAGIKKDIRLHLILESSITVTQAQLKYLFTDINKTSRIRFKFDIADLAYYSATQPHFFADPMFKDGIKDPFILADKPRLVYVKGETICIPPNLPEFTSKRVVFEDKHLTLLDSIKGRESFSDDLEEVYEELKVATDGLYLRIIPKIYHKALQEGVNLDWLESKIKPYVEAYCSMKPGKSVQEYFNNGRKECLRVFIGEAKRDIPTNIRGVKVEQYVTKGSPGNYLELSNLPPPNYITFIKGSLGTGKTTAIIKWLKMGDIKGNFLAVTNTRSLVASNAKKFESGQYDDAIDMLKFKQGKISRMSTTIHSLHKFRNMTDKIDFLFIDECDAVMNDLLFAPVVKQRRECIQTLFDIIRCAKYVILSDGDVSAETIEAYGTLVDFDKPICALNHHRKMLNGVVAHEFLDENSVWVALQTALEIGDKCLLVSDCGPAELNEKGLSLRNATGLNVKEIHSSSTQDHDIKDLLVRTNEALIEQTIDAILCSPSLSNGVDWNYFDSVFVLTKTSNQSPNMRFQALRRDRGAKTIYFYTSKKSCGFMAGSDQYLVDTGWLERAQQLFAARREIESKNFPNTFRYYLIDQGATINIFDESWGKIDSAELEYTEQRINAILASTVDYTPPRHNDAYDEKLMLIHYFHLNNKDEVTYELVEQYVKERPHDKAKFFHKLQEHFWSSIMECNNLTFYPFMEALKKYKKEFFLATGQSANPKLAKMYLTMAGIKDLVDKSTILDYYRTYCKLEEIQLPTKFMTTEELKQYNEKVSELE